MQTARLWPVRVTYILFCGLWNLFFFFNPYSATNIEWVASIVRLKTLAVHKGTGLRWKQVIWTTNGTHCANWGYSSLLRACFTFLHVRGLGSSFSLKDLTNHPSYLGDRCALCFLSGDWSYHTQSFLNLNAQLCRTRLSERKVTSSMEQSPSWKANCPQVVKKCPVFYRTQRLIASHPTGRAV
jgi:hypothetical protein